MKIYFKFVFHGVLVMHLIMVVGMALHGFVTLENKFYFDILSWSNEARACYVISIVIILFIVIPHADLKSKEIDEVSKKISNSEMDEIVKKFKGERK